MAALTVRPMWIYTSPLSDELAVRMPGGEPDDGDALNTLRRTQPQHTAFVPRGVPANRGARPIDDRWMLQAVTITDGGALYEVAAERRDGIPTCTRMTIAAAPGGSVADAKLTPGFLAAVAVGFWEAVDAGAHDLDAFWQGDANALWQVDSIERAPERRRYEMPPVETIARHYRDAEATPGSKSARFVIAAAYGVSHQLASNWIAAARKAGAIPPATRSQGARGGGRPRKQSTTKGIER